MCPGPGKVLQALVGIQFLNGIDFPVKIRVRHAGMGKEQAVRQEYGSRHSLEEFDRYLSQPLPHSILLVGIQPIGELGRNHRGIEFPFILVILQAFIVVARDDANPAAQLFIQNH